MRTILNISLPKQTALMVKSRAKKFGFSSVSEYVRLLFNMDDGLISENEILKMAREADREYSTGKIKRLKSLKELVK